MNILIVIANYLPVHNPNVFRWSALAEYWVRSGNQVHVLTTKHTAVEQTETINGVQVHRTGYATLKDLQHGLIGKENTRNIPNVTKEKKDKSSKWLETTVDLSWRKFYWPDGSMPFIRPGTKLGSTLIKEYHIDKVFSVGLPFSCHLIARNLKEKNPTIHWHMDIEDPFCYSKEFWVNNFKLYKHKNIREEEKAFQLSDSISVTNEEARLKYREFFPEELHKLTVIPPLHIPSKTINQQLELEKGKTHLGYFGSFYKNVRSPEKFLEFLSYIKANHSDWMDKHVFHFFGQANKFSTPIFEAYWELDRYIEMHGLIDRDASIDAMKQLDVLINFGNTTSYHLPSKVVDYLAADKKILNIKAHKKDSFEAFANANEISEKRILNISFHDATEFKVYFEKLNTFIAVKEAEDNFEITQYSTQVIADQYLDSTT